MCFECHVTLKFNFSRSVLFSDAPSNVRIESGDLIRLSFLPPHPDTEVLRWGEVQSLRILFSKLCESKLGTVSHDMYLLSEFSPFRLETFVIFLTPLFFRPRRAN